jgi:pantoate--beta-alanine ligase
MLVVTTIAALRSRREELLRRDTRVAFVPTMGALHEGHLALVHRGRALADEVWVSVFVNPTQFAPHEDFTTYPRDLESDREALERSGAAVLFAPSMREMYPRPSATTIDLAELTVGMCGAQRPGHFRGVALVVTKLLNIVQPDVALFGAKDWQQATVIRRLVEDLNIPTRIEVHPTVREDDGVALSSRNAYLSPPERAAARVLSQALGNAEEAIRAGERRGSVLEALMAERVAGEPLAHLQYAAAVDPDALHPVRIVTGRVLLALAVFVGSTRLIDNLLVEGV